MILKSAKLLVILGPTSTGKTDLALQLAKKFNGELVSCDSRQVYSGLDIGTGKLPGGRWKVEDGRWKKGKGYWEIDGVRIWMYDVADPKQQYTVYNYVKDANRVMNEIIKRGKRPIIVGGTGLYLKALLEGLPNLAIPVDKKLREELQGLSQEKLQERLQQIAPDKWENLNESDRQNPRRLVRAIEIASANFTSEESLRATVRGDFNTLKIGLTAARQILYQRIDERVVSRINQGMVDEARNLHRHSLSYDRMKQLGLEYGILADYLQGHIKKQEELIKIMRGKIHGYARRQHTWFKNPSVRLPRALSRGSGYIHWFDITDQNYPANVENRVAKWYDSRKV